VRVWYTFTAFLSSALPERHPLFSTQNSGTCLSTNVHEHWYTVWPVDTTNWDLAIRDERDIRVVRR